MRLVSPLENAVAKGKENYNKGRSFEEWKLVMTHKYGSEITPHLEDAWKLIQETAKQDAEVSMTTKPSSVDPQQAKPAATETLYRMTVEGRFAPVPKEDIASKVFELLLTTRKTIVAVAAVAFVLAGLFPPWLQTFNGDGGMHSQRNAGYHFILNPPRPERINGEQTTSPLFGVQLDTSRLFTEWLCICAAAGAAWFLFGASKPKQNASGA